jgi:serine/threonine protein kinase
MYSRRHQAWKIVDLGLARNGTSSTSLQTRGGGTPIYMAPEFFSTGTYTNKVDIWALGCIIYEICTGERLFTDRDGISTFVALKLCFPRARFPYGGDNAEFVFKLIKDALAVDRRARPNSHRILQRTRTYLASFSGSSTRNAYSFADKKWLKMDQGQTIQIRCISKAAFTEIHEV